MENLIQYFNKKYESGECEKKFKHSDFAIYSKNLCLKETEIGNLKLEEITGTLDEDEDESTLLSDSDIPNNPLAGIFWVLLKAEENDHEIDILNDTFSIFQEEWGLFNEASLYGMIYASRIKDDGLYCDRLARVAREKVDPVIMAYLDSAYYLYTGYHFDHNYYPIYSLSEGILETLVKYRYASDIEREVVMNRTLIEDNVLYALDEDNADHDKVVKVYSLLYKVAATCNKRAFMKYASLNKPLPKFIMIRLYSILNSMLIESIGMSIALLNGDIHELTYDDLNEMEIIVNGKLDDELRTLADIYISANIK